MTPLEEFRECWGKYQARLKGGMLGLKAAMPPSFATLADIYEARQDFWKDRFEDGGGWLERYHSENPQKGELVKTILLKDMHVEPFTVHAPKIGLSRTIRITCGVGAGYLVNHFYPMSAKIIPTSVAPIATIAVCGIMGYCLGLPLDSSIADTARRRTIDEFLNQLEKYRLAVETILAD